MQTKERTEHELEVIRHNFLYLGLCLSSNFLKKQGVSEAGSVSICRRRNNELVGPLVQANLSQQTPQKE
jgi:hypothetical protein